MLVEPCKGEILPHRRFETVAEAKKSSAKICKLFWLISKPTTSRAQT